MDLLRIAMEVDPDVEDPHLEDLEVLQVLSRILQVDTAPDLGVLSPLITDHHLVVMDHLMTISKGLRLEEVGEVGLTAEAVEVAEVFATGLLDLEDLDQCGVTTMMDLQDPSDQDQIGIKVAGMSLHGMEVVAAGEAVGVVEVLTATDLAAEVLVVQTAVVLVDVTAVLTAMDLAEILMVQVGEVLVVQIVEVSEVQSVEALVVQIVEVLVVQIAEVLVVQIVTAVVVTDLTAADPSIGRGLENLPKENEKILAKNLAKKNPDQQNAKGEVDGVIGLTKPL